GLRGHAPDRRERHPAGGEREPAEERRLEPGGPEGRAGRERPDEHGGEGHSRPAPRAREVAAVRRPQPEDAEGAERERRRGAAEVEPGAGGRRPGRRVRQLRHHPQTLGAGRPDRNDPVGPRRNHIAWFVPRRAPARASSLSRRPPRPAPPAAAPSLPGTDPYKAHHALATGRDAPVPRRAPAPPARRNPRNPRDHAAPRTPPPLRP